MKKEENITYDLKVKEEEILTLVILLSQLIEDYQYNQEHKKKRNKIEKVVSKKKTLKFDKYSRKAG